MYPPPTDPYHFVHIVGVLLDTLGLYVNSGQLTWIFCMEMDQKKVCVIIFVYGILVDLGTTVWW